VKNKILLISLAMVLALSLGLVGCGDVGPVIPDEPTSLVIGTARDTDESLSIFEWMAAGPVMRAFVKSVNDGGGIHLKQYDTDTEDCYVNLEIDRREINVGTWDVGDVTAEICADINGGDVHYLWGGPGTDCIFTQAPIANGAKTVLFTFEGGATSITNNPLKLAKWPYVFVNLSYSDWYQLPVLSNMLEEKLTVADGAVKAYVVHIWGEHGIEYLAQANEYFDVVEDVEIPFNPAELDADEVIADAIAALNATPYDIFCSFAYPDHNMAIVGQAVAQGFDPPAFVTGPGANFGFFQFPFGGPGAIDGMLCFAVANEATSEEMADMYELIADQIDLDGVLINPPYELPGFLAVDYWGDPCYWAALEIWRQAVENAGYVDQELLRDALAATEDDPVTTVMGETWYRMFGAPGLGGGNLDWKCHTGEVGQWISGAIEVVGYTGVTALMPNYVITGNFTFPMTGLWPWLP
jgi:ABC-type branched-subunit amino acid transport system substrate-binding protein